MPADDDAEVAEDPRVTLARQELERFRDLMDEYGWYKATKVYYGERFLGR